MESKFNHCCEAVTPEERELIESELNLDPNHSTTKALKKLLERHDELEKRFTEAKRIISIAKSAMWGEMRDDMDNFCKLK